MQEQLLAHLKHVVGDTSEDPWTEDNIPYLFQRFRPDGAGLISALATVPNASAYIQRLLPVFTATKHPKWPQDMYFVVRNPPKVEDSDIISLGRQFLANLQILGSTIGSDELSDYFDSILQIEILANGELNFRSDGNILVYETIGDFLGDQTDFDDPIPILDEAYYTIACDRDLAHYLQWPYYQDLCPVDCFQPYFRLWELAVSYVFDGSKLTLARRSSPM
jgi:hypothetical protein